MKRWLRTLSQDFPPLHLSLQESTTSPTSTLTPVGIRYKIQHLSAVGEYDFVGQAGTVSNVSIFNADRIVNEAAQYDYDTRSGRLESVETASSHAVTCAKTKHVGEVSPLHIPEDRRKKPAQHDSIRQKPRPASPPRRKSRLPPLPKADVPIPPAVRTLFHEITQLESQLTSIRQRLHSLTTINRDDKRRLNEFIDVLRRDSTASHTNEEAEQTLCKLERLFVRSSNSREKVQKEAEDAVRESAQKREKMERMLAETDAKGKAETESLEAVNMEEQWSEKKQQKADEVDVYIAELINQLEHANNEMSKSRRTSRSTRRSKSRSNTNSISEYNGESLQYPFQPDPAEDQIVPSPLSSNPPNAFASRPPSYTPSDPVPNPKSRSYSPSPSPSIKSAYNRVVLAQQNLTTAQHNFDILSSQHLRDAHPYTDTYQSCLKSVTNFDLDQLQHSRKITRELIEVEDDVSQAQVLLKRLIYSKDSAGEDEKERQLTQMQAVRGVDRVRIERWRQHLDTSNMSEQAFSDNEIAGLWDCEWEVRSLGYGESVCGFADREGRQRIDRWEEMKMRMNRAAQEEMGSEELPQWI